METTGQSFVPAGELSVVCFLLVHVQQQRMSHVSQKASFKKIPAARPQFWRSHQQDLPEPGWVRSSSGEGAGQDQQAQQPASPESQHRGGIKDSGYEQVHNHIICLQAKNTLSVLMPCGAWESSPLLWYLAKQFLTFGKRIFNVLSTIGNLCIAPCDVCSSLIETSA